MSGRQKEVIVSIGLFLAGLATLNGVNYLIALGIAFVQTVRGPEDSLSHFPIRLFVAAFFLTNLAYVVGSLLEIIYLKLWDKPIRVKEFLPKFFKAASALLAIVYFMGLILFVLS